MPARMAIGENERRAIFGVLDHYGALNLDPGYQGHFEKLYTDAFVSFMGGDGYADAVNSGTVALYLAIAALNLPPKSQVVVSPIADAGTISAISENDLVPVLADTAPESFNIDAEQIRQRVNDQTSAIVVVHAAGQAAGIGKICDLARQHKLRVVEDCAQAHGAARDGSAVGTFGDIAAFSTMFKKAHVTGGSGGIVFTKDEILYHRALALADRGKQIWRDDYDGTDPSGNLFPALNFNADEVSCAIGLASLERLAETNSKRLAFVNGLAEHLAGESRVCRSYPFSAGDAPFFVPIFVDEGRLNCSKKEFALAVREEGIPLNPDYRYVVRDWPWAREYLSDEFECPNAVAARDGSFNIYVNENYGSEEVDDSFRAILKVESHFLAD